MVHGAPAEAFPDGVVTVRQPARLRVVASHLGGGPQPGGQGVAIRVLVHQFPELIGATPAELFVSCGQQTARQFRLGLLFRPGLPEGRHGVDVQALRGHTHGVGCAG